MVSWYVLCESLHSFEIHILKLTLKLTDLFFFLNIILMVCLDGSSAPPKHNPSCIFCSERRKDGLQFYTKEMAGTQLINHMVDQGSYQKI